MLFKRPVIPMHIQYSYYSYIYTWCIPLAFPSPLAGSPLFPLYIPFYLLAPSSCDRNRPPPSQVACKLTPFALLFTQLSHPFQIPRTPTAPCLTMKTSGIFRLLLSGTSMLFPSAVQRDGAGTWLRSETQACTMFKNRSRLGLFLGLGEQHGSSASFPPKPNLAEA